MAIYSITKGTSQGLACSTGHPWRECFSGVSMNHKYANISQCILYGVWIKTLLTTQHIPKYNYVPNQSGWYVCSCTPNARTIACHEGLRHVICEYTEVLTADSDVERSRRQMHATEQDSNSIVVMLFHGQLSLFQVRPDANSKTKLETQPEGKKWDISFNIQRLEFIYLITPWKRSRQECQ